MKRQVARCGFNRKRPIDPWQSCTTLGFDTMTGLWSEAVNTPVRFGRNQ